MSDEVASPKISVVVPVYKVEKYLQACVESVLAQSFEDFELILVDDGSPDKCGEICDELAKKDSRIRVFHQANGGATSARRLGVEQACGEWICFVDPDDLLPKDSFKDLITEATNDVDWVQGWRHRFEGRKTPKAKTQTGAATSLDLAGLVEDVLTHHTGPCAKLVRRKLFSQNVLDIPREIRLGEDTLMNLRLIANRPRKPKEIDKVVYFYRQRENSVTHTCLRTESCVFSYAKLLLAELRKIADSSNREQLLYALSRHLSRSVDALIAYGLPIKFPRRLATLIRRGAKTTLRGRIIYFCLGLNCVCVAYFLAKICHFIHGKKFDASEKTLLE